MKKFTSLAVVLTVLSLGFGGCVAAIGNDATPKSRSTTVGQELIDLQKAKEAGALTEQEYQAQKAKILNSQNR